MSRGVEVYRCSSGIPEFADIENLFYTVSGEITSPPPSTAEGVREYYHSSYNGCFSKVEVHDFRSFLGYVLTDGHNWSVGLVSCVIYIVPPCIPNTRLHNQKVSGVYRWEFKYHVGILSNRHMIRYGVYHMFVPAYSTSQSFILF